MQAETEVANLTKRVRTLEEDFESTEARLVQTQLKLEQASKAADDSERLISAPASVARIAKHCFFVWGGGGEAGSCLHYYTYRRNRLKWCLLAQI